MKDVETDSLWYLNGKLVNGDLHHQSCNWCFQLAETREEQMLARLRKPRGSQIAPQTLICDAHEVNVSLTPSNESWTKQNAVNHGRRTCIVQSIHCELHFPKSWNIWAYNPCMHIPKLTGSFWKSLAPLASQPQHTTGIRDFTHTLWDVISATNCFTDLASHPRSARLAMN